MTINELVRQLQKQAEAIGGDSPVVLYFRDDDYGKPMLDEPVLEVRELRVKGRGAPAYPTRKSQFTKKGVVLR